MPKETLRYLVQVVAVVKPLKQTVLFPTLLTDTILTKATVKESDYDSSTSVHGICKCIGFSRFIFEVDF